MSESTWVFDDPVEFCPSDQLGVDLAEIFAAAPDMTALHFFWQHASYDRGEFFGARGFAEPKLPEFRTSRQIADENPRLGALLRCLEQDYNGLANIFPERDGGEALLVATRSGHFFAVERAEDFVNAPQELIERDPGGSLVACGVSIAADGEVSAHHAIAAMAEFRAVFPDVAEAFDEAASDWEDS